MSGRAERRSWAFNLLGVALALFIVLLPLTEAATLNLTYDANGNLVTGDGKYRVYNNQNQLVALYNGSNVSGTLVQQYAYHPTEERILSKKTYAANDSLVETVIYVGVNFVRVINASGTYNYTYIHANGQQVAQVLPDGTKQYLLSDIKGSATVTTNGSGDVVERTSYAPYGAVLEGGTKTRYQYEEKEFDSIVDDTDFNFRKYNPLWGIFTQPDTLIQNVYDPQSLNRYSFERNSPYKYADPTGHQVTFEQAASGTVEEWTKINYAAHLGHLDETYIQRNQDYVKLYKQTRMYYPELPEEALVPTLHAEGRGSTTLYEPRTGTAALNLMQSLYVGEKSVFNRNYQEEQRLKLPESTQSSLQNMVTSSGARISGGSLDYGGRQYGYSFYYESNGGIIGGNFGGMPMSSGLANKVASMVGGGGGYYSYSVGQTITTRSGVRTTIVQAGTMVGGGTYSVSAGYRLSRH